MRAAPTWNVASIAPKTLQTKNQARTLPTLRNRVSTLQSSANGQGCQVPAGAIWFLLINGVPHMRRQDAGSTLADATGTRALPTDTDHCARVRFATAFLGYGNVGVSASMVSKKRTSLRRSSALVNVSTPAVPALR